MPLSGEKENNNLNKIKTTLSSFQEINLKYISLESSEKFLGNLINNNLNLQEEDEEEILENNKENYERIAQLLIQEIIEYRQGLLSFYSSIFLAIFC